MKHVFVAGILFTASVLATGCGGGSSTPPAGESQAPAPVRQEPRDPAKEIASSALGDLHGAPPPSDETRGELFDIGRDLLGVAAGSSGGTNDLADDVQALGRRMSQPPQRSAIDGVITSLGGAIQGKTLSLQQRTRLAVLLYSGVYSSELRESDRTAWAADLSATLKSVGASGPTVTAVGRAAANLGASPADRAH